MKKIFAIVLSLVMLFGCVSLVVNAETEGLSAKVNVTISNKGNLVVTQKEVVAKDIDGDDAITVNDVLYAAHKEYYSGGVAEGYGYYVHESYGLSLGKLWGDNSGNFGYYVNDKAAWSLADPVNEGDYVNAFVYSDGTYYSDMYTFFDVKTASCVEGEKISLTLSGAGYDSSWNPITVPVADATITLNGEETSYRTDENGMVDIVISDAGNYTISAISSTKILVPPVCVATVTAVQVPSTSENTPGTTIVTTTEAESDEFTTEAESDEFTTEEDIVDTITEEKSDENTTAEEKKQGEKSDNAAKTGDNTVVFIAVLLVSSIGLGVISYKKKETESNSAYEK